MKEIDPNEFEEKRIDSEAASWVAKRNKGLSATEQDAFLEWMAADPRHMNWYKKHMKTWRQLNLLAQWKPEHSERPNPYLLKKKANPYSPAFWVGIAAVVMLGLSVLIVTSFQGPKVSKTQSFVAETYKEHVLTDGSVVEMKEGAALKVDFRNNERKVELVSSEAHFDVVADPENPFVVKAKGFEYRAIGTAFSISIDNDQVDLLVTEGTVIMASNRNDVALNSVESNEFEVAVIAGQRSVAFSNPTNTAYEVFDVNSSEIDQLLQWKPKSLSFNQVSLQDVLNDFNSRNEVKIVLMDDELKEAKIVASFHSANVAKLLMLLESTMDIRADYVSENRILLYPNQN